MHSQEFIQRMKERLLEEKERLTEELQGLSAHTELGDEADENANEVNLDEVSSDIAAAIKNDLEKIEIALKKADQGTYGMTDDGQQISEERLEVLPWADTVIES